VISTLSPLAEKTNLSFSGNTIRKGRVKSKMKMFVRWMMGWSQQQKRLQTLWTNLAKRI
jgi:hypothetical protein